MTPGLSGQSASLFIASSQTGLLRGQSGHPEGQGPDFHQRSGQTLAQLLELGDSGSTLSQSLARHGGDLRRAFGALPVLQREAIQNRWGQAICGELLALSAERDPELFGQALLNLASRLAARNNSALAAPLYQSIGALSDLPSEIQSRAHRRLEALQGRGEIGDVAEAMVGRFAQEATEPTSLLAMGVAGAAFKVTRLATLSRLVGNPSSHFLTRGFGARALASATGFGVEATVFPLAGRLANEGLGRRQDWSRQALGHDLASSFLFLGAMKMSGWAAGAGFNRLHGLNPATGQATRLGAFSAISRPLVPQLGMLGGIMAGHELEVRAGLREAQPASSTLVHSLAMLLQFNVAGRATRSLFGDRWHAWEQGMERQSQILGRSPRLSGEGRLTDLLGPQPALAMAGNGRGAGNGREGGLFGPQISAMSIHNGEGNGRSPRPGESVSPPGRSPSVNPPPSSPKTLPPALDIAGATRALDQYRDHRTATAGSESTVRMAEALRFLKNNPESARRALIGRNDLSDAQLNELSLAISPEGNRVLTDPGMRRVLIPNRGEIAHRIARGLYAEGLTPIVIVPQIEANAQWVQEILRLGGEAEFVQAETPAKAYQEAYLNIERIVETAKRTGAQAVHPGYGYRSESPDFVQALTREGLVLIGPSERSMRLAGDKDIAKQNFIEAGVPVVPGTNRGYTEVEGLVAEMEQNGMIRNGELAFPVRLKAVAGGGGRGQATIHTLAELRARFSRLSSEAANGFGNGSIMAERFISRFHHVEFQVMADRFGNVVHLGERECTLQERGQKLIEIHPASIFSRFPSLRERMAEASLKAARAMEYTGHGTVEFMVDPVTGEFFAMEVNARIQVEHRVSEEATGFDLIREAIRVSRGFPLSRSQEEIHPQGGVVEIRLKAVDPNRRDRDGNAAPAPGLVEEFQVNGSGDFASLAQQGIFVETSVRPGDRVSPNADPMIAKIVVTGSDRRHALERAADVLGRTILRGSQGFASDLKRQEALLRTRAALEGTYDNRFVDEWTRNGGGENLSVFANAESRILSSPEGTLHVQVGGAVPPSHEAVELWSRSARDLLSGQAETQALSGPIADLLRSHSEIRQAFASAGEAQGRWIQASNEGEIRQAVLYQNARPRRVLLARSARMPNGQGNVYAEKPVVYDIQIGPDGHVQEVGLHVQNGGGLEQQQRLQTGNNYLGTRSDGSTDIFTNGQSSTPLALNLRLIPAGNSRGLEIRDRANNILVSLAPDQVMESPAQRLLSLFEFSSNPSVPEHVRRRSQGEINGIIQDLANQASPSPVRLAAMQELGSTPASLVRRLLSLSAENRPAAERQLLDEILARREISGLLQRHRFESYEPLSETASLVRFTETGPDAQPIPRLMLRVHGQRGEPLAETVAEATRQMGRLELDNPQTRDNVIQVVTSDFSADRVAEVAGALNLTATTRSMVSGGDPLRVKRLTLVVERNGGYPDYYTFRRQRGERGLRSGPFVEDTRFRNVHPMLAHFIELHRLSAFDVERDLERSGRQVHIYRASNKQNGAMAAGSDQRLFGSGLISEAHVQRGYDSIEIPEIERGFVDVVNGMHEALNGKTGRRSYWNRIFLNIQPVLPISDTEVAAYAETLATRHADRLRGLGLEKVVVKGRLRDAEAPGGFRTVLVRITNPTGQRFEPVIHNVVRARVQDQYGTVATREVLIRNGAYENWLAAERSGDPDFVIRHGDWAPADVPIRPASTIELREQQARARGATWAYRVPALIAEMAERFRLRHGLGQPRLPGSERPPEPAFPSEFVELELDPATTRTDPRTRMIDYNHGELVRALDEHGMPRAEGQNQAGVVIGIQTDHLGGTGMPLRRVVILGDLTHRSKGALSANECARINAAIRLAAREGIPVDWFTASQGAEIHAERGVEGLDATASTVREIVQHAHSRGVPINIVVDDVNIGAQSYWNSLASIIHDTGGILIMTPRGSMALTGPDAWTAAMVRHIHSEDLPGTARKFYPRGLQSLAGYEEVHGPNADAMALAPDLARATEMLLRHHYYSYRLGAGEIVSQRQFGGEDLYTRDISVETIELGGQKRQVGEEIQKVLNGGAGHRETILEALRDRGSPPPLRWWADAQGIRHQAGGNGLMPQKFNALIQEMQIGGRPTMVIFPPLGPLAPADSEVIGRAIIKASGRMPVLLIGSLTGFNGDPRSMENRQLFGGATIAEAIVKHQGPITVVDLGYIVGGTFVVVSKQLNPNLRLLALEGSHAQVIGGPSAAKVVFRSTIRKEADADARVLQAQQAMERASASEKEARKADYERIRREVIAEIEQSRGAAFDQVHSVQRAETVGAVDEVIRPDQLREAIIRHQQQALNAYNLARDVEARERGRAGAIPMLRLPGDGAFEAFRQGLVAVYGEEGARSAAQTWIQNLQNFAGGNSGEGSSGPGGPEGNGSGNGPASPP
ncbi:MAG TPA: biotin carboxylase N-terminal domain-containing protein [bacterium]|nr:biotin carboxylase N-terminal domain-containing protein [bacterium]